MKKGNSEVQTQKKHRNDVAVNALDSLLQAAGFDAGDLQIALEAIQTAKEITNKPEQSDDGYEYYKNKTLIFGDNFAFIFQRPTSKSGRWYVKIYDERTQKPYIKSLKTKDKEQAFVTAREIYVDIKGKIERGERLKSITTPELVELWDAKYKEQITDIPHEGITYGAYKVKRLMLNNWLEFIEHLSLTNTAIDKIKPYKTRDFAIWLKNKPKQGYKGKPRSVELINSNISEVHKMYNKLAARDKYISKDLIPEIDRLKQPREEAHKRDVLTEEQYEILWKYLQNKYITKKHNPDKTEKHLELRKIFKEFVLILANIGFRSKELLGIRVNEIMDNPAWSEEKRQTDVMLKVRRENSKTGKSRASVAPIKKRIDRIFASYKKLGIKHEPNDYLFMNPDSKTRNHYTRDVMSYRLKEVLRDSGLQEDLDKNNSTITLYSFRHQYASWRLRYGQVDIHLLARQMGTSTAKIESTYAHIMVELEADKITKNQEPIKRTDYDLGKIEVVDISEEAELTHSQKQ